MYRSVLVRLCETLNGVPFDVSSILMPVIEFGSAQKPLPFLVKVVLLAIGVDAEGCLQNVVKEGTTLVKINALQLRDH